MVNIKKINLGFCVEVNRDEISSRKMEITP